MSYQDLCEKFKKVFDTTFEYKNDYHKNLIEDYIGVIGCLSNVFAKVCEQETGKYDFYAVNELDSLGLKDIYIKFKTSQLASLIKKHLKNDKFHVSNGFNNKKGTIDINYQLSEKIRMGIQIEGMQYRCFVCKGDDRGLKELLEQELWFLNTQPPMGKAKDKTFCQYDCKDWMHYYRYQPLDSNFTLEEIVEKVVKDAELLVKNEKKIKEIIK